jgi:hypothetical protein
MQMLQNVLFEQLIKSMRLFRVLDFLAFLKKMKRIKIENSIFYPPQKFEIYIFETLDLPNHCPKLLEQIELVELNRKIHPLPPSSNKKK